jgi:hypothetical protein
MEHLSRTRFPFESYGPYSCGIGSIYEVTMGGILAPGIRVLGYRDAGEIDVRPRPGEFVVLFWSGGIEEEFWFHLDKTEFERLKSMMQE